MRVNSRAEERLQRIDDDEDGLELLAVLFKRCEVLQGERHRLAFLRSLAASPLVNMDARTVSFESIESGSNRVREPILSREHEHGTRLAPTLFAGEGGAATDGLRNRERDPSLANLWVAFENRELAEGDVGFPQPFHRLRLNVHHAHDHGLKVRIGKTVSKLGSHHQRFVESHVSVISLRDSLRDPGQRSLAAQAPQELRVMGQVTRGGNCARELDEERATADCAQLARGCESIAQRHEVNGLPLRCELLDRCKHVGVPFIREAVAAQQILELGQRIRIENQRT